MHGEQQNKAAVAVWEELRNGYNAEHALGLQQRSIVMNTNTGIREGNTTGNQRNGKQNPAYNQRSNNAKGIDTPREWQPGGVRRTEPVNVTWQSAKLETQCHNNE